MTTCVGASEARTYRSIYSRRCVGNRLRCAATTCNGQQKPTGNGAQRRIIRLGFGPKRCLNPESATGLRNLVGTALSASLLQEDDEEGDDEEGDEEVPRNANQQTCRLTVGLRYRYLRVCVPVFASIRTGIAIISTGICDYRTPQPVG